MRLSQLKWWHWTLATLVIAAAIRLATGGSLPFVGRLGLPGGPSAKTGQATAGGRPAREPNTGPQMREVVTLPGFSIDQATPELNRLTVEGSIPNPGTGVGLVDQTGVLAREIGRALQKGVREDSTAITDVRILVATKGVDRTGKQEAHLALFSLDYKASDLYALKSDAAPAQVLAEAQGVVFNGADAHKAMRDWCAVSANFNDALAFCNQVTSAKGV
jgi:hypothetical protein